MASRFAAGARVRHAETGRSGRVVTDKRPRLDRVTVRFDGDARPRPCDPRAIRYLDGDGR